MCKDLSPCHADQRPAAKAPRACRPLVLLLPLLLAVPALGQSIINGNFSSGTSGWSGCQNDIGVSWLYGGSSFTDKVASINGGISSSTSDDNLLCQTISSLVPGTIYQVSFQATRCPLPFTPSTVSVSVVISGNAAEAVVSRTGGWNMTTTAISFVATSTSHDLTITPNFNGPLGLIVDNISLSVLSPLPITLLYFDAQAEQGAVQLDWATASERDNVLFSVERSDDLEAWHTVAEVAGAGTSVQVLHYAASDAAPLRGTSYYRLRQTDADGASTVSDLRSVSIAAESTWQVWPDPADDQLNVRLGEPMAGPLQVFDMAGRTVARIALGTDRNAVLDVAGWPAGMYRLCAPDQGKSVPFIVR